MTQEEIKKCLLKGDGKQAIMILAKEIEEIKDHIKELKGEK